MPFMGNILHILGALREKRMSNRNLDRYGFLAISTNLGSDIVLLLLLLHSILNTADNFRHHFVIQVPGNALQVFK